MKSLFFILTSHEGGGNCFMELRLIVVLSLRNSSLDSVSSDKVNLLKTIDKYFRDKFQKNGKS